MMNQMAHFGGRTLVFLMRRGCCQEPQEINHLRRKTGQNYTMGYSSTKGKDSTQELPAVGHVYIRNHQYMLICDSILLDLWVLFCILSRLWIYWYRYELENAMMTITLFLKIEDRELQIFWFYSTFYYIIYYLLKIIINKHTKYIKV
jgi:hypothetical protein